VAGASSVAVVQGLAYILVEYQNTAGGSGPTEEGGKHETFSREKGRKEGIGRIS